MSGLLEYNEKIVSWIQPVNGCVEDQIPALRINGEYYQLSLRMMKSIWRHVRLRKDFVNKESAPYGGVKLRIPSSLFHEKMRTQNRFKVRLFVEWAGCASCVRLLKLWPCAGDANGEEGKAAGPCHCVRHARVGQDTAHGGAGAVPCALGEH